MSKQILYIEDNVEDQRLVRKVLTTHGYELVTAGDGESGLALAEMQQPDLILVDLQMPGLSGLETVQRLRQIEWCAQVPIVGLTAYAEKVEREACLRAGFTDYLQKQAGIKPLLALVKQFLG
ncbi:MAG TPA: response regulator [Aggregatilineaceae bacterium]|nr:response regulator [Aggregatilineaceae bacterium]